MDVATGGVVSIMEAVRSINLLYYYCDIWTLIKNPSGLINKFGAIIDLAEKHKNMLPANCED